MSQEHQDGIKELDNQLPRWWLQLFYICIIFSLGYFIYYEILGGLNQSEELEARMAVIEINKSTHTQKPVLMDETQLAKSIRKPERVNAGLLVYQSKCISCHGAHGEGGIGPNLTDNYWIHGKGKLTQIAQTIREGVPAKGMPPWGTILSEEELYSVIALIDSLRGSQPAGAKAPQGELGDP